MLTVYFYRTLSKPEYPLTSKLINKCSLKITLVKTEHSRTSAYENSLVQKYLRAEINGCVHLYMS